MGLLSMNIFNALRVYAGKWNESAKRNFTPDEISAVSKAEVVESNYGLSVCFLLFSGGQTYIPLDQNSSADVGDIIDLNSALLVTLSRPGEDDIYRVRV